MEELGWTWVGAGENEVFTWSTWNRTDPATNLPFQAHVSVLRLPWSPGYVQLSVEVCKDHVTWASPAGMRFMQPRRQAPPLDLWPPEDISQTVSRESGETFIYALVCRLLSQHDEQQRPGLPTVWAAQLPPSVPFVVPIPPGGRLLGSMQWPNGSCEIAITAPMTVRDAAAFYRERCVARQWRDLLPRSLDQHRDFDCASARYAFESDDSTETAGNTQGELTLIGDADGMVRIYLSLGRMAAPERGSPDTRQFVGARATRNPFPHLLQPPQGLHISLGYGGGSTDTHIAAHARAQLESAMEPAVLMAHYVSQLVDGGWTLTDSGITGPLHWSTWVIVAPDRTAEGRFVLLQSPLNSQQYRLQLQYSTTNLLKECPWLGPALP